MFLFSVKPEDKPKEKVIPCLAKNRWILPMEGKFADTLDRQAAEELMKGLVTIFDTSMIKKIMMINIDYFMVGEWVRFLFMSCEGSRKRTSERRERVSLTILHNE